MARVLLNLSSPPAGSHGGVARFGIDLARDLAVRGGHSYTFRSQWPAEQLPAWLVSNAAIEVMQPLGAHIADLLAIWVAAPFTHPGSKFDLIVNLDTLGFATGGRRRMTIVHDLYFRTIPEMYSPFLRAKQQAILATVLGRSHGIVGISEATSAEVRRHFPGMAGKVRTILSDAPMRDIGAGDLPAGLTPGGYVLAVANATPNKNFGVLAQAFARIAPAQPQLKLVHVGDDPGEAFAGALVPHGLGDRVIRLRGVDDPTLAALYRDALCLVVPSLAEGFCLPLIEAQRLGCPTVFSDRSATGEVGGDGGIAFDPVDVDALASILLRVSSEPELRAGMIARGHANAARFSWAETVDGYEQAIADVLA